jgi:cell filamentation protein
MFDPFNDFATAGYLRNVRGDKAEEDIKSFEHNLFRANMPDALEFLSVKKTLTYPDFLEVHRILFSAYYPWAGQDRTTTMPASAVSKGSIFFSHPNDVKRAVDAGLRLGQSKEEMNKKPGEVMGLFAYGHPFLDGNGRTMLIVHSELCYRAGFSIDWSKTFKTDYLNALSGEIKNPGHGVLDSYLLPLRTGPAANQLNRLAFASSRAW